VIYFGKGIDLEEVLIKLVAISKTIRESYLF
jgi:hypothetical protein